MPHAHPIAALQAFDYVNLSVVLSLALLCLLICVLGALRERMHPASPESITSPSFPSLPDYAIAFLLLAALLANSIIALSLPISDEADPTPWLNAFFYTCLFLPVLIRILFRPKQKRVRLGFKKNFKLIVLGVVATWILSAIAEELGLNSYFIHSLGSPEEQDVVTSLTESDWNQKSCLIVSAIIIAPLVEECLFRGLIYPCLRRFIKPAFAMILCGCLFGAIHMALPQLIPLSALGCYLCYLYERSKSLFLPILTHMVFNSITVFLLIVVLPLLENLGYDIYAQ